MMTQSVCLISFLVLLAEEDQEKGLCSYLDADTLSSWIGTAIRYMNLRSFVRVSSFLFG